MILPIVRGGTCARVQFDLPARTRSPSARMRRSVLPLQVSQQSRNLV